MPTADWPSVMRRTVAVWWLTLTTWPTRPPLPTTGIDSCTPSLRPTLMSMVAAKSLVPKSVTSAGTDCRLLR